MRLALDAMGGDHAPGVVLEAVRLAVVRWPELNASLWRRVTADADLQTLAGLHYALSAADWVDDKRFFGSDYADRPWQPLKLKFVDVHAGEFQMGSSYGGQRVERPRHTVSLSGFSIGATPVTNADFWKLRGAGSHKTRGGPSHPAFRSANGAIGRNWTRIYADNADFSF